MAEVGGTDATQAASDADKITLTELLRGSNSLDGASCPWPSRSLASLADSALAVQMRKPEVREKCLALARHRLDMLHAIGDDGRVLEIETAAQFLFCKSGDQLWGRSVGFMLR